MSYSRMEILQPTAEDRKDIARDTSDFQARAERAVGTLKAAMEDLVAAIGADWTNPAILASQFGITKSLAWKISRMLSERESMAVLAQIPGQDAFEILYKKSAALGVREETLEMLKRAVDELDTFTREQAGDRMTLQMMAAGCWSDKDSSVAMNHRKAAFVGNGFNLGVQAGTQYRVCVLSESLTIPGTLDMSTVSAFHQLRKSKPIDAWCLGRAVFNHDKLNPDGFSVIDNTLKHTDTREDKSFLSEFCSNPMPKITRVQATDGALEQWISDWPIGDAGAVSVVWGIAIRSFSPTHRVESGEHLVGTIARVHTPTEWLVMDVFVRRSTFASNVPEFSVINDAGFPPSTEPNLMRRISIQTTITALGRGVRRAACRHLPKCDQIARAAFDKFELDDRDFELYRFELRYPPLASSVAMFMRLRDGFAAPAPVN